MVPLSDTPRKNPKRPAGFQLRRAAERELIDQIATAARRLAEARDSYCRPVVRTDGVWRVLTTVARSPYCLAIADLAAASSAETHWLITLTNGLGDHELRATTHVVKVIRQRLERDARELAQRGANR